MERSKIKDLLEKYLEGETSLTEEKILTEYFTSAQVASDLLEYKPLFTFFKEQRSATFTKEPRISKPKNSAYKWLSIAASLVLVCSLYFFTQQNKLVSNDTKEVNHELAMKHTQELLYMMTNVMNDGKKQLQYLNEFEQTKNQIIQK